MPRKLALAAILVLLPQASLSQPQPVPPVAGPGVASPARTLLPVKAVMHHIINPAAELYWQASGEIDTAEGAVHRAPAAGDDDRWNAAVDAAATLQEGGNLLMMRGRARDDGLWQRYAQQLVDAGALGIAAAEARDEKKTFDAGTALYNACFNCHERYIPRPANSLYGRHTPDEDFKPPK